MSAENANLNALWPIMRHHHKFDFKWVQTISTNAIGNLQTTELGYFVHQLFHIVISCCAVYGLTLDTCKLQDPSTGSPDYQTWNMLRWPHTISHSRSAMQCQLNWWRGAANNSNLRHLRKGQEVPNKSNIPNSTYRVYSFFKQQDMICF